MGDLCPGAKRLAATGKLSGCGDTAGPAGISGRGRWWQGEVGVGGAESMTINYRNELIEYRILHHN